MAGHSQFKNIMHRKGAQDKKRAKVFTKIIRELTVAARNGDDPEHNPALRQAIITARGANMPKDTMERAIKRGAGGEDGADYTEVRYEGYGPGGVAIIVDALTDNKNRTAAEVRSAFNKYAGNMGESGSVAFMFDRVGVVRYPASQVDAEKIFEAAIEAGADNVESTDEIHEVECAVENFASVRDNLIKELGDPESSELMWKPQTTTALDEDKARTLMKLIDVLEDNDDVQNVSSNFEVDDEVMQKLSEG